MSEDHGAHYLRPAGRTHTPPAVIILDSETRQHDQDGTEVHTLRCWDAQVTWRRDKRRAGETRHAAGDTAGGAADAVDAWASYGESTWLYAHNVAFDMVVTGMAAQLVARGWELSSRHGLSADGMWCVLHKGRRETRRNDQQSYDGQAATRVKWGHTLTIADSCSIFPKGLAELAPLTGVDKPALPADDDSAGAWAARCRADVEITAALVLGLMDWWDEQDMGPWAVTGAGLGWQTYRRHLGLKQMVIDHDPALAALERQAVYGGWRDTARTGQLPPGRHGEVDYEAAYPTIAASFPLPARAACPVQSQHRQAALAGRVPAGMLAEVTLTTSTPRWPVRVAGRVLYPVGTFKTVLAAPDIQAAADAGALAAVHDGWLYTLGNHLRPWARWVLQLAAQAREGLAGIVATAAKLWCRAVIGKFAQKGWRTEAWVGPPSDSWTVEPVIELYHGTRGVVTGLCGTYWRSWADQRGEHERPAVLAFVEAHVRQRLAAVLTSSWASAITQWDTDGVMADYGQLARQAAAAGSKWRDGQLVPLDAGDVIAAWSEASWPLVMREKQLHRRVGMLGPQHLELDGRPRMSGVGKGAWKTGEDSWAARLWPGIVWQAGNSPPGEYARPVQRYRFTRPTCGGWVLADGAVRPPETAMDLDGSCYLLPWADTRHAAAGDRLGPSQPAWAEGLWETCDA